MSTQLQERPVEYKERAHPVERRDEFHAVGSEHSLGFNVPQKVGSALWLPMWAMAVMGLSAGMIVAIVRANEIASGGSATTVAALGQVVPGLMFIGFAAVFAAVSFAIARILGSFRKGGGEVQETAGSSVQTLAMPSTARAFLAIMAMAMMLILGAVVLHFVIAAAIAGGSAWSLEHVEQWSIWLEAARRTGVALYLFSITLGLATIVRVLRFQAIRIREVADTTR